jgi:hypothetical protein
VREDTSTRRIFGDLTAESLAMLTSPGLARQLQSMKVTWIEGVLL